MFGKKDNLIIKLFFIIFITIILNLSFLGFNASYIELKRAQYKSNEIHSASVSIAYVWESPYKTQDTDYAYGIDIDTTGNIYITGTSDNFTSSDVSLVYVAKFDIEGNFLWNVSTNYVENSSYGEKIDLSEGSFFITGALTYDIGGTDTLFALGDSEGVTFNNYTWGKVNRRECGNDISIDKDGNKYITGETEIGGNIDTFLIKYNSSDDYQWNKTWGYSGMDVAKGVVIDNIGDVYIAGYTDSFGTFDAFIAKYNSSGVLKWNHTWGGVNTDGAYDIAVDKYGNVYLTGFTNSFGTSFYDAFIIKYDTNGNLIWYTTWGDSDGDIAYGITTDENSEKIYITGDTTQNGLQWDTFIAIYDTSNNFYGEIIWGDNRDEKVRDIAVYNSSIYIVGWTDRYELGNTDGFIAKFSYVNEEREDDDDDDSEDIENNDNFLFLIILIISLIAAAIIAIVIFRFKRRESTSHFFKKNSVRNKKYLNSF
ncbi:MAG: SBBP repeat-containing protein [Promethearchaeota archaeon]